MTTNNDNASAWAEVAESGDGLVFEDFLSFRVGRLNTLLLRETTQKVLEPAGLTHPEWRVLARLAGQGSLEMRQLTRVSLMDKAAISRAVDALIGKGLAERHTDPAHAKRRIVAITPAGRRTMRKVLPAGARVQAGLLRLLRDDERLVFERALATLTQALLASQAAAPEDA